MEAANNPVPVLLPEKAIKISSGWSHNLAISGSGSLFLTA